MPASVAMPAVRQKRSKLAPTCCQASSTIAAGTTAAGVVDFSMALLSFADSAPRAYWLKAGNAYLTFSTSTGTSPLSSNFPISGAYIGLSLSLTSGFINSCAVRRGAAGRVSGPDGKRDAPAKRRMATVCSLAFPLAIRLYSELRHAGVYEFREADSH
jgi:hypothetical protein